VGVRARSDTDGLLRDTAYAICSGTIFAGALCDIPSGYTEFKPPSNEEAGVPFEAGLDGERGDGEIESGTDGSALDAAE
jgi:hypothetical protein